MTSQTNAAPPTVAASRARLWHVLPLAFVTYSLAYLDRVNIGFGEAGGMSRSLGITDRQFGMLSSSFFFGYVLSQIPGASYAAHRSVKKLMFVALLLWSVIASLTGLLTNYHALLVDRFLLGVVEGVVFPSLLVFLTHWFTKRERSFAYAILIQGNPITVAWASVVSGYLVQYFVRRPWFGLQGWQLMLLSEGAPTLLWAIVWWWMVYDRPGDAPWLTPDEKREVENTLEAEQRDVKQVKNYAAAFLEPQVILFCLQFMAWSIGIYGLNMWLPVILRRGSTLGMGRIGLMNAIPYLIGALTMAAVSKMSDRLLIRKHFVWPFMFLGALAFGFSYIMGQAHFWLGFVGLVVGAVCMYAPYGPFWAMVPEMVSRNVVGESMALINTMGAVGGFFGTYFVQYLRSATGGYGASFMFLGLALAAAGLLTLLIRPRTVGAPREGLRPPMARLA